GGGDRFGGPGHGNFHERTTGPGPTWNGGRVWPRAARSKRPGVHMRWAGLLGSVCVQPGGLALLPGIERDLGRPYISGPAVPRRRRRPAGPPCTRPDGARDREWHANG